MPPTDTSEAGLESLILSSLTGLTVRQLGDPAAVQAAREGLVPYGGAGYFLGNPGDYDREFAVDLHHLLAFLQETQPQVVAQLGIASDGPNQRKFLARLQGEISKRGVIDVLRRGISHYPANQIVLFYATPSPGNRTAQERFAANHFSVTRQLRYSRDETRRALDLCLFINGLPIATFELKNRLTRQTVHHGVDQYKRDRDPREPLFHFGRCAVHFAVDDQEVYFCTELKGEASWFLPFNQGHNDGAGNPPNPNGIKTDYLWKRILTRHSLSDIVENYAQVVEERDERSGRKRKKQIWPRYHQLDGVRRLLAHAQAHGPGKRYLIQHSAGSGKSNSIAWLAHQLVGLEQDAQPIFDSVIVVTDRIVLDRQIRNTIRGFAQVSAVVAHAERSGLLRDYLTAGKKIIITTVQKFPFILNEIGHEHRDRTFAILIDEAHSSQSGRTAAQMNMALAQGGAVDEDETVEDTINRIIESRRMLPNASYFAFTATPKNKTLEIFGEAYETADGVRHRAFHSYTMKQAIQEEFIRDVLQHYTPVQSYYRLMKTIADDPEFDSKKAQRKLRHYVESHEYAIRQKAEIMVDHFHDHVIGKQLIGGQARAMVITSGIQRAIDYYHAIESYLRERHSPYRAIVAFSGEHEYAGQKVTEASLNGFPATQIEEMVRQDPYRFLVVADKFQTGYDEPLLHTMYVDKPLSDIKAVQTLSRLNRAHPQKRSTFVLDFVNDEETIRAAFENYYRATILSGQTDPNRLHDLQADLERAQVYTWAQVEQLVAQYLSGAERDQLDPILEACVEVYREELDEDGQVDFKGKAKAFVRAYNFLAAILPIANAGWEKLATFLNFLIPKLPAPKEDDLSQGILDAIDMESYRAEVRASINFALADAEGVLEPLPTDGGGFIPQPELERLSAILQEFNDLFGNIPWTDKDRVAQMIAEEIPVRVAANEAYQNAMRHSDKQNARIEHDRALQGVILQLMNVQAELFKRFHDDPTFKRWLSDKIFANTYQV